MTSKQPAPPPYEPPMCIREDCGGPMVGHRRIGTGGDRHYGPCTGSHKANGEPCRCPGYLPEVRS